MGRKPVYSRNKNYFFVPNLENSYWAGFLAADGWIYKSKLGLQVSKKDLIHLQNFLQTVKYNGPTIPIVTTIKDKSFEQERVEIWESQWVKDLKTNFNITQCKSLTLKPPIQLSEECQLAFIKGYVDGDGWIGYDKTYIYLGVAGTFEILDWIKNKCDKLSPSQTTKEAEILPKGNIFSYKITGLRTLIFLNILKNISTPYLSRKWDQVKEL